ncbi:MAG: DUF971 domain-containing protein [Deltaproteobacteria bacterium]|nr:DUF971 domain-containing protein [Deltaproteobacteria bacterium]
MENTKRHKPADIRFDDRLVIQWKDGVTHRIPYLPLRDACPCAACVDELSGQKTLDPATIPPDIHLKRADYVGNYALRLHWSDGHGTGLYTFRSLRQLGEQTGQMEN